MGVNGEIQPNDSIAIVQAIQTSAKAGQTTSILFIKAKMPPMKKLTLNPGIVGITYNGNEILDVDIGSQAHALGICVGWRLLQINGENCVNDAVEIDAALNRAKESGKPYIMMFLQ